MLWNDIETGLLLLMVIARESGCTNVFLPRDAYA